MCVFDTYTYTFSINKVIMLSFLESTNKNNLQLIKCLPPFNITKTHKNVSKI